MKKQIAKLQTELQELKETLQALSNLPSQLKEFMENTQQQIDNHIAKHNQMTIEIGDSLKKLLNGDAQPHQETLDQVTKGLFNIHNRLVKLETAYQTHKTQNTN